MAYILAILCMWTSVGAAVWGVITRNKILLFTSVVVFACILFVINIYPGLND